MRNQRRRSAKNKEADEGSNLSSMPIEIIVMILNLLPMKDAVVTSSLSKKWRSMWHNLTKLNFDGTENIRKIERERRVYYGEQQKYFNQVNGVISTYNHQVVQEFRICFYLNSLHQRHVDSWLEFAVKKKVEIIDLDCVKDKGFGYMTSPFKCKWPSSNTTLVEMVFLKQLSLKNVNVTEDTFQKFLTNSPNLETISIHGSIDLINIRVSGQAVNLKNFEIHQCDFLKSIHLSDFDLVSFDYMGQGVDLILANLPNLSKIFCQGHAGSERNTLNQISSGALSLQDFSFLVYRPQSMLNLDFLRMLPNVKKLTLKIGAYEDECLLEFTSIAKSCPNLESLTFELFWFTPIKRRRKVTSVATYRHEHLKLFQILGYHGRVSDLELVAYVIENAVALKKIVIDPRFQESNCGISANRFLKKIAIDPRFQESNCGISANRFLKDEECARSSAKRQLIPRTPPGVSLVIL